MQLMGMAISLVCGAALAAPTETSPGPAAAAVAQTPVTPITRSALDAPLFYELIVGELELRRGNLGNAFQPILDAARRTQDERLYQRAVEIALRGQAGEQALSAAKAWRVSQPQSREACEYVAQILLALNRPNETVEPLRAAINLTPADTRSGAVASIPRFLARMPDHKQAAQLIDDITSTYRASPETAAAAWVASGRGWLAAGDASRALDATRKAAAANPADDGPALLAADLIGRATDAELLLKSQLETKPKSAVIRLAYARKLIEAQRLAEAADQLEQVTQLAPDYETAWLTLGAARLDLHQPKEAESAVLRFLSLREAHRAKVVETQPAPAESETDATSNDDARVLATVISTGNEQDNQAYLLLSQAAQQRDKLDEAQAWLQKIPASAGGLPIVLRRAYILQKQGRINDARELIRQAPAKDEQDARSKILAETTLLRDSQRWREAYAVLEEGNKAHPDDTDLLYEQGMLAEKLKRYDDMERLLRRVIALQPGNANAYNALGFSLADHNQRLPEARQLIAKALELSPGDPFITDSLGWVEFRLGHLDEAARLLGEAYKSRPDPEIAAHLGEVLWQQGKQDEARSIWRDGQAKESTNETLQETLHRLKVSL
jgi:tetratricopeptide (TPR) repeat protein